MEAARLGHIDILTFLLTSGASANVINFECRKAPSCSASSADPSRKVLLAFDANVELGDVNGQAPLMVAVKLGSVEVAKLLIESSPNSSHAMNKEGDNVLGIVAYNGQLEIVRLLLNCDLKVNLSNGGATTPLMLAAAQGHAEIINALLDNGAWNGHTALTFAAESGQVEAAGVLLEGGAQVNTRGVDSAPLTPAVQRDHVEMIKLLLVHSANVNLRDSDGDSALHEAVYSRSSLGIDLDAQNESGWTPSMAAAQRDLVEIFDLSLQRKALVKKRMTDGRLALQIAADEGRVDVIRLLLQHGARIDVVNKAKWIPLMMAASRGHRQTAKFLVNQGASLV
ncbi:hypothetical protein L916_08708 [Phytophthora nicotianae]|uniref:Uncharacterized protein n=1 Tax=Phytophthora nicotianae TaxID=4792 RepID=W2J0P3_PHYNI|nr:hypothetical protein L916_08708 [Phytophthora nicotianae]